MPNRFAIKREIFPLKSRTKNGQNRPWKFVESFFYSNFALGKLVSLLPKSDCQMTASKKSFEGPAVIRKLDVSLQSPILGNSVMHKSEVKSVGQEVKSLDFNESSSSFNFEWDSD